MWGESVVLLLSQFGVCLYCGSSNGLLFHAAIRSHALSEKSTYSNPQAVLLDIVATQQVLAVSDRLWTEATGSRTPIGGLGTFWDDASPAEEALDINDLLED